VSVGETLLALKLIREWLAREPKRRFPVLYLLHGFTSVPSEWLDGSYPGLNLQMAMDSLLGEKPRDEFLVVMPDANSRLGGGFYTNSPVSGGWADFVVRDLVGYIDGHYRTQANRLDRDLHTGVAAHHDHREVRLVRRYENELGIVMHQVRVCEDRVIAAEGPARLDQPVRPVTKRS
jgi:hypothetical protein